ncbi:hypothetical protein C8J57DRAFT_1490467 [Mycena rebaudengoi]|nr:hypothetical protein C8J57DRAFT_1490467 [Mycena rebaudengoi]
MTGQQKQTQSSAGRVKSLTKWPSSGEQVMFGAPGFLFPLTTQFAGVGKSTLLNALLKKKLLPFGSACTAVTTEISYNDVPCIEAHIEFMDVLEWGPILGRLLDDANDTTVDTEEEPADNFGISPAFQAKDQIFQVYPELRDVDSQKWPALDALLQVAEVRDRLGTNIEVVETDPDAFRKELADCLASGSLRALDHRTFWPLVKIVRIMGRFDVLSTGLTLVDLPGHGDTDETRNNMASTYLKTADSILLVAGIARAIDDKDTHTYLQKHLSQLTVDGRMRDDSIALVLTGTDHPIDDNEVPLVGADQEQLETLTEELAALNSAISKLNDKLEKKQKSPSRAKTKKAKAQIEKVKEEVASKREQVEAKDREKSRLLAKGRSELVSAAVQDKYARIYRELANLSMKDPVPSIPVIVGHKLFSTTAIPLLMRHLQIKIGEHRNLKDAIGVITSLYEFLKRSSSSPASAMWSGGIQEKLDALDELCFTKLDVLIYKLDKKAEKASPGVFAKKNIMKWNQYKAMMRANGKHENGDLNVELTEPLRSEASKVMGVLNVELNSSVPLLLKDYYTATEKEVNATVKTICASSRELNFDDVRQYIGVHTVMARMDSDNSTATTNVQRQRTWELMIKDKLLDQYALVGSQKGPGMYKRMKASFYEPIPFTMNKSYLESSANDMFGDMNTKVREHYDKSIDAIKQKNREHLRTMLKQIHGALIGSKQSPEKRAKSLAQAFQNKNEEATLNMLHRLEARFQEIERSGCP